MLQLSMCGFVMKLVPYILISVCFLCGFVLYNDMKTEDYHLFSFYHQSCCYYLL